MISRPSEAEPEAIHTCEMSPRLTIPVCHLRTVCLLAGSRGHRRTKAERRTGSFELVPGQNQKKSPRLTKLGAFEVESRIVPILARVVPFQAVVLEVAHYADSHVHRFDGRGQRVVGHLDRLLLCSTFSWLQLVFENP